MNGINFEENECPCFSCIYMSQITKKNETLDGKYDLLVQCAISGCPKGFSQQLDKKFNFKNSKTYKKISRCMDIIKRCIENKINRGEGFE